MPKRMIIDERIAQLQEENREFEPMPEISSQDVTATLAHAMSPIRLRLRRIVDFFSFSKSTGPVTGQTPTNGASFDPSAKNQTDDPRAPKKPDFSPQIEKQFIMIKEKCGEDFVEAVKKLSAIYGNDTAKLLDVCGKLYHIHASQTPYKLNFVIKLHPEIGGEMEKLDIAVDLSTDLDIITLAPECFRKFFELPVGKLMELIPYLKKHWPAQKAISEIAEIFQYHTGKIICLLNNLPSFVLQKMGKQIGAILQSFPDKHFSAVAALLKTDEGSYFEMEFDRKVKILQKISSTLKGDEELMEDILAHTAKSGFRFLELMDEGGLLSPEHIPEVKKYFEMYKNNQFQKVDTAGKEKQKSDEARKSDKTPYEEMIRSMIVLSNGKYCSEYVLKKFLKPFSEKDKAEIVDILIDLNQYGTGGLSVLIDFISANPSVFKIKIAACTIRRVMKSPSGRLAVEKLKPYVTDWLEFLIMADLLGKRGPEELVEYNETVHILNACRQNTTEKDAHIQNLVRTRDTYLEEKRKASEAKECIDPEELVRRTCIKEALMSKTGQWDDIKYQELVNLRTIQTAEIVMLVQAGYSAEEIRKMPEWLVRSKKELLEARDKFPVEARNDAKAMWCATNAFYRPKNWQVKKLGSTVLMRLSLGVDTNIHNATHWLGQFEIPEEKEAGYVDADQELLLLKIAAEIEKCFPGVPKKKQVIQYLFHDEKKRELYEKIIAEPDFNKRKELTGHLTVESETQPCLKKIKQNSRLAGHVVSNLKELGEKRKKYSEDAQSWVTMHGMTPSKTLIRAWKYRPKALEAGCKDNPASISTWGEWNEVKLLFEALKEANNIPIFLQGDNDDKLKSFALELSRCSSPDAAARALIRLSHRFNPEQKIPATIIDLGDEWKGEIIPKTDVRGFTIGYDTGCCMTIDGASESCIYAGYSRPDCGFFILTRDDQLIAQSFIWVNEGEAPQILILDNIEAGEGRDRSEIISKYQKFFQEYMNLAQREKSGLELSAVNLGMGYVEIDTHGLDKTVAVNPPADFYTDAKKQKLLCKRVEREVP